MCPGTVVFRLLNLVNAYVLQRSGQVDSSVDDDSATGTAHATDAESAGHTDGFGQQPKPLYAPHFPSRKKPQLKEAEAVEANNVNNTNESNADLPGRECNVETVGTKQDPWLDPVVVKKYLDRGARSVKSNRSRFVAVLQGAH